QRGKRAPRARGRRRAARHRRQLAGWRRAGSVRLGGARRSRRPRPRSGELRRHRQAPHRQAEGRQRVSWSGEGVSGNFDVIWHYAMENLRIAVAALLLGGIMAFPIGVLGYKRPHTYPPILVFSSVLYSVPSLAFFVLLYA